MQGKQGKTRTYLVGGRLSFPGFPGHLPGPGVCTWRLWQAAWPWTVQLAWLCWVSALLHVDMGSTYRSLSRVAQGFALFKQLGNSGRHSGEGESQMGLRYWCPCANCPHWIKRWATGPQGWSRSPESVGGMLVGEKWGPHCQEDRRGPELIWATSTSRLGCWLSAVGEPPNTFLHRVPRKHREE